MSARDPGFSSRLLIDRLRSYPAARKYLVGFSGGADSTALLFALGEVRDLLKADLEAIHFNHGLQAQANAWQRHCQSFCAELGIPLTCHALDMSSDTPNLEGRARDLRYGYLESSIDPGTIYLTAHNADDRAETLLINALRGSGIDGLASIPEVRALGRGLVARPLLEYSRASLESYLANRQLDWLDDPSNQDTAIDRNFLRLEVIPLLESRWPAARQTLARTASHARSASALLDELLSRQAGLGEHDECLPVPTLHLFGADAAGLVLRAWLRRLGAPSIPEARLLEFLGQLANAAQDAQCETAWSGWTLRRFREELRLLPPGDCPPCPRLHWSGQPSLDLGPELGELRLEGESASLPVQWSIGPREPGSVIRLATGGPRRKLKKLFQELPIPPWQRSSIPVVYWGGNAVAIGDWMYAPEFSAWLNEQKAEYLWQPTHGGLCQTRRRCRDLHAQPPA